MAPRKSLFTIWELEVIRLCVWKAIPSKPSRYVKQAIDTEENINIYPWIDALVMIFAQVPAIP